MTIWDYYNRYTLSELFTIAIGDCIDFYSYKEFVLSVSKSDTNFEICTTNKTLIIAKRHYGEPCFELMPKRIIQSSRCSKKEYCYYYVDDF